MNTMKTIFAVAALQSTSDALGLQHLVNERHSELAQTECWAITNCIVDAWEYTGNAVGGAVSGAAEDVAGALAEPIANEFNDQV